MLLGDDHRWLRGADPRSGHELPVLVERARREAGGVEVHPGVPRPRHGVVVAPHMPVVDGVERRRPRVGEEVADLDQDALERGLVGAGHPERGAAHGDDGPRWRGE